MTVRGFASHATALLVAFAMALAVPVAQLTTVQTVTEACCCPDPAHCKCPSLARHGTRDPQLLDCHRTSHDVVAAQLPPFSPPALVSPAPRVQIIALSLAPHVAAHPAPDPRRPAAPS